MPSTASAPLHRNNRCPARKRRIRAPEYLASGAVRAASSVEQAKRHFFPLLIQRSLPKNALGPR